MEKTLCMAKSDLVLSGIGSIAFGIWFFVKTVLYDLFARSYINNLLGLEGIDGTARPFVMGLWFFASALTMVLHLYVGLRAVSEGTGRGRRRGFFYLILAGMLLLNNGYGLVFSVHTLASMDGSLLDQICDVMMNAVRLANLAALLRSVIQTRKLTRQAEQEAKAYAD